MYSKPINLYPLRSYRLYRASVPVQYDKNSNPPLGRTEPTVLNSFAMQIYLQTLYEPYGLYSASETVQYIYTSIPPLDRTEFAENQCIYSSANYLLAIGAYCL